MLCFRATAARTGRTAPAAATLRLVGDAGNSPERHFSFFEIVNGFSVCLLLFLFLLCE